MSKCIPIEALILLQNQMDQLPKRDPKRRESVEKVAQFYDTSISTVYRSLSRHTTPKLVKRSDYNRARILDNKQMRKYCEIIAAIKLRTKNKKGHYLSTKESIRILEECGVELGDGLVTAPKGVLKLSTVSRYIRQWGYDDMSLSIEPPCVRFQATYSNECWQFDFSPSDFKQMPLENNKKLMLASIVDDRSGTMYQEYLSCYGEDVETALKFLFNAMTKKKNKSLEIQGIPKMIYMDAGSVSKSKLFKRVMAYLDIDVRIHMPKGTDGRRSTARSKGKVERGFRTVKSAFESLYHFHVPETLSEANQWLQNYLIRYNNMNHRIETHSRIDDWKHNLPSDGFREMCSWDRFCSFAREPEERVVGSDARVTMDGVQYQVSPELSGEKVTVFWGLFDHELYVEYRGNKQGPFYPSEGPIPLGTFKKYKTSKKEKLADHISTLAKTINIPKSVLSGIDERVIKLLEKTDLLPNPSIKSVPFTAPDPFEEPLFKSPLDAKVYISTLLGVPLARLTADQSREIDRVLGETLDKKMITAQIRAYFKIRRYQEGDGTYDVQ